MEIQSTWWMESVPHQTGVKWGENGEEVSPGMDWVMSENMSSELEGWSAEQVGFLTES